MIYSFDITLVFGRQTLGKLCVSKKIEDVLLVLLNHPEGLMRSEIRDVAKIGAQTQKDLVKFLLDKGLAEEVYDNKRDRVVIRLTEKGRKIAELVKQINELLNS